MGRSKKPAKGSLEWYQRRRDDAEAQVEGAVKAIARTITSVKFWRGRARYYDRVIRKMDAAARQPMARPKRRITPIQVCECAVAIVRGQGHHAPGDVPASCEVGGMHVCTFCRERCFGDQ
ncbi:MAG: hypothetical protein ACREI9_05675 [Nitrospiraceae bacterium]